MLVSTLLDHDGARFPDRTAAIAFAQGLIDSGHIASVVGAAAFEDSVHLYRWCDVTVVEEAKRKVATTSSYIPRRRLVDMIRDLPAIQDVKRMLFQKAEEEPLQNGMARPTSPSGSCSYSDSGIRLQRTVDGSTSPFSSSAGSLFSATPRDQDPREPMETHRTRPKDMHTSPLRTEAAVGHRSRPTTRLHSDGNHSEASGPTDYHSTPNSAPPFHQNGWDNRATDGDHNLATCRYDGVEMPALDIENINFASLRSLETRSSTIHSPTSMTQLADGNHGLSDNEKHLLEQIKTLQTRHADEIRSYETKINQLVERIAGLNEKTVAKPLVSKNVTDKPHVEPRDVSIQSHRNLSSCGTYIAIVTV